MHKSRLAGFIIDCQTTDLEGAANFWSAALGYPQRASAAAEDDNYALLETGANEIHIELQSVEHESRLHLDIETDDIEAEARRLEGLGARRVKAVHSWLVMEAPTGHRFCLVNPARADFADEANQWEGANAQ